MVRVFIVEDSLVEQELLTHILGSDPQIQVVGVAGDGEKAIAELKQLQPDVVTMDIHMPRLDGYETTRRIMEVNPLPIVIVSGSFCRSDTDKTFRALEAGALAMVRKPRGIGHPEHLKDAQELVKTVKMMSEVKVVKRWPRLRRAPQLPLPLVVKVPAEIRIVAIGASTGGPAVIQTILSGLPPNFNVPLLVVQHMAKGFMAGFVAWLTTTSGFPSLVAGQGDYPLPGRAYFAPDDCQMQLGRDGRILITRDESDSGLRPSAAHLFRSVAEVFGRNAVGVLLTGMGKDGAKELKLLRECGGVTIAQNQESSVVFGMPGEAVKIDAADYVLAPERIVPLLVQLCSASSSSGLLGKQNSSHILSLEGERT